MLFNQFTKPANVDTYEKNLNDLVSRSLHEMAWRRFYSINPGIGIHCFVQAFKENGFIVNEGHKNKFIFHDRILGTLFSLQSELSRDEILTGWKNYPKGSPQAFYDSIYETFDRMDKDMTKQERESWEEDGKRFMRAVSVRKSMEQHLVNYFAKYQDVMLLNADGTSPKLKEPKLFRKVLEKYPMEVYKAATTTHNDVQLTPCAETLVDMVWDFDEEYHPSAAVMEDYFWAHYLHELAEQKNYKLDPDEPLKRLCMLGWDGMPSGREIWRQA